ncbi:indolepyruvate ferredoxin oxidoreductase subunit alpha [Chloroflexota bacterium]
MLKLLSGNEALALGAYDAGVMVATAYPGTPSTEILENLAGFKDIYAEWSTNEKVAMEVALGASYAGVRTLVSMKHVGLNVAGDPFMAASITGVKGGLVVITADDPGMHSSQNEQDNRHYARLAKVPMLEPANSQQAYDIMPYAFAISEEFDTPVLVRSTTRISHSRSVVEIGAGRKVSGIKAGFQYDFKKFVMLPACARRRHPLVEERLLKLAEYCETFSLNRIIDGDRRTGIISAGIAFNHAREVFPQAAFLKLTMTYPLPQRLIKEFAAQVDKLLVVEELDPFMEEQIKAMGIDVTGKEFIPLTGELSPDIIKKAAICAGILTEKIEIETDDRQPKLPGRPPLLCPGCPHSGIFYVLSNLGQRSSLPGKDKKEPKLIITGDIGCYTLGASPPLSAMDTCACMGAGIGQALGMEKAGENEKIVAVIGDSTFLHSGITGLVNAVYNKGKITVIILDNRTTAMTGHQEHPGTGITAQGEATRIIELEPLVRGIGVEDIKVIDAWDIKALRASVKDSIYNDELSVIIVRGACAVGKKETGAMLVDEKLCNRCNSCLMLGCPAIRKQDDQTIIDASLCAGESCALCLQVCPRKAIKTENDDAAV